MQSTINLSGLRCLLLLIVLSAGSNSHAQKAFEVEIRGEGAPLIFIPGLISGGDVWDATVDSLEENYECHVLTLAGFAGAGPLDDGPYLTTFRDAIIKYIKENNLDGVRLVGHSLGGFLSLMIGLENVPGIDQLIIVDAMPFLPAAFNPEAKEGFKEDRARAYMESLSSQSTEELRNTRRMIANNMSRDSTSQQKMVNWAMNSDLKTEAYSVFEMMGMDLRDELSEIDVPVYVLLPFQPNPMNPDMDKDTIFEMYVSQYENLKGVEFAVFEGSGHFIMLDRPKDFIDTIKKYLALH